jgi:hypothetical protein
MTYDEIKGHENSETKQMITSGAGRRSSDWCSVGAVAGLTGGIVATILGSILTALSWFSEDGAHAEKVAGTVLLVLTIPLLVVGAQCLDLMDKKKESAREARFHESK